ncbi:MAG: BMP family ABC transporter substrate-binding protein [Actinobacteria bacterium]|nr:BMP family ABC transporter substrate-binding protein [Actinomycetota bacterium]
MKTNVKIAAAVFAVAALGLAGCGGSTTTAESSAAPAASAAASAPAASEPAAAALKACEVTDVGGVDDKGFNQKAYKGVTDAADQLGVEAAVLESQAETDYAPNIQAFVDQGCNVIVTVGFLLGDATMTAANANPDIPFTIVDYAYGENEDGTPMITNNNVLGQVFNTDEAAFLAGYLAAGTTKTGKVGTFGGINIPPVTIFMDGFYYGVQKYNADNGTKVEVLGWDPKTQKGLFTENFEKLDDGRTFAQNLVDEGADIVMPVAGPVGLGSAALATELGTDKLMIIGVDSDQYESDTANQAVYLTSVLKNMDVTTFNAIKAVADGTFAGGVTVGTLANGGVGLAPYHDMDSMVSPELKDQMTALQAGIIDGSVSVKG